MITYQKLDEETLRVTRPTEVIETVSEFNINFLRQQKKDIIRQRDEFVEARNKELAEVTELIAQAKIIGVATKVLPEITPTEEVKVEANPLI